MGSLSFISDHLRDERRLLMLIAGYVIPLMGWLAHWIHSLRQVPPAEKGQAYFKCTTAMSIHHITAMAIATISLLSQRLGYEWEEGIGIAWSCSFYTVGTLHCLIYRDYIFFFHDVVALGLGLCNWNIPILYTNRLNSKASLLELSTLFLYQVKRTRNPIHFVQFALSFFLVRIVYLPWMIVWHLHGELGMSYQHPAMRVLIAFYGLQLYWFAGIVRILRQGDQRKDKTANKNKGE